MELDPTMLWNIILTLIVAPATWAFSKMFQEVKEIISHLQRLEDKIDRFIERNRS